MVLTPIGYLAGQELDSGSWLSRLWTRATGEKSCAQNESKATDVFDPYIQLSADVDSLKVIQEGFNSRCNAIEHSLSDFASTKGAVAEVKRDLVELSAELRSLKSVVGELNLRCDALGRSLAELESIKGIIADVGTGLGELQSLLRASNEKVARFEANGKVLSRLLGLLVILWAFSTLWLLLRR